MERRPLAWMTTKSTAESARERERNKSAKGTERGVVLVGLAFLAIRRWLR
jgi:hypothetical protein